MSARPECAGTPRFFRICEDDGIRMIPVALRDDAPDIDEVERLVAADSSIKAMWCRGANREPAAQFATAP
jgi:hypothetical protein